MADEITITVRTNIVNGEYSETFNQTVQIDQAAIGAYAGVEIVPTTDEAMPVGDVATEGYLFLKNLDGTNFITFGPDDSGGTFVPYGKCKPGEIAIFRVVAGAAYRWKADTATVKTQILLLED